MEEALEELKQEMVIALMKRWFPNRLPTGEDYERWVEIAMADADAIVTHLVEKGMAEVL